jgi:hypothetical protein
MLFFLFAEQPLSALIAVNIKSPCYVTNAEYYVTEFSIKKLQKHQGFIITTTVKPFMVPLPEVNRSEIWLECNILLECLDKLERLFI